MRPCRTPCVHARTPCVRARTQCVRPRTPCVRARTPCVHARTPCVHARTPCVRARTRCIRARTPRICVQTPYVRARIPSAQAKSSELSYHGHVAILDFFHTLDLAKIEGFVADGQEEHLSLEFKSVDGSDLHAGSDRKNLARALSGFANSAGGIVVWGVRTRPNKTGLDVAAELVPIPNVSAFVAKLHELTPLYVTPPVEEVIHRKFGRPDDSGFAASFIPESDRGPHMALAGHHRYFKRAGDRYYRMEHFDISDMFGRRQRPALRLAYSLRLGSSFGGPEGQAKEVRITFSLVNEGRSSAVAPYARFQIHSGFRLHPAGAASQAEGANLHMALEQGKAPAASLVGSTDVIIHPKVPFQIAEATAELWGHHALEPCRVTYLLAALNAETIEDELIIPAAEIAAALDRSVEAGPR